MRRGAAGRGRILGALLLLLPVAGCQSLPEQNYFVFFDEWSARIDQPGRALIRAAALYARANPGQRITVIGYADPTGSAAANQDLSRARADVVTSALIAEGVPAARIRLGGLGELSPKWSNQESRRVEIRFDG